MTQAMIRQLLYRRRRLLGVGLAILIGAAFLTITMLTGRALDTAFRAAVGAEFQAVDLMVEFPDGEGWQQAAGTLAGVPGVAVVQPQLSIWTPVAAGGKASDIEFTTLPPPGAMRDGLELDAGRLPEQADEIVLHRQAARDLGVDLDGTITIDVPAAGGERTVPTTFRVVGFWSGEGRFAAFLGDGFITEAGAAPWLPNLWVISHLVEFVPGSDPANVSTAISAALPDAHIVTASEAIDRELLDYEAERTIQQAGISAFAILALIVAGIVVANTCAILVAQRAREIALFRCAGATGAQVRTMVLTEAIAAGLVASVLGVLLAWAGANVVLAVLDAMDVMTVLPDRMGLSPAMVVPVIAGVIVVTAAAWGPARSAASIEPLQALRTAQAPASTGSRPDPVRIGVAILLMAAGAIFLLGGIAISWSGSIMTGILVGIVGGLGTFLGVLVGASVLVPAANRAVTRLTERLPSVPARIASSNGARNPRRSTATTIALVIGVALVTMMIVGAETLKATMTSEVDSKAPWDLSVDFDTPPGADAAESFAAGVAGLEGVANQVELTAFDLTIEGPAPTSTEGRAVDPAGLAAVWRDADAITSFGPGVVLLPQWAAENDGLADGDQVSLTIDGSTSAYRVIVISGWDSPILPAADIAASGVAQAPRGLFLRLEDGASADTVLDEIYALADSHGVVISADALVDYRETLEQALDTLLYIVSALLGVAVLIAVVGVGNTLSLSVIERTSESALLRSLGYTRRQLRQTLMLEGVFLAAIGAVIGLVLGTIYGWIGALTVIGNTWSVVPGFPVGRLALVAVIALACGLLASVLPARRAASVDPVTALAEA